MPSQDLTPGEIGRTVARVEEDVRDIKADLKGQTTQFVPRGEYETRMTALDREIMGLKSQITKGFDEIKSEVKSGRPQWWVVAALLVSSAAVVMPILTR